MGRLFIGTSGYSYTHWKGSFYPKGLAQKNWLAFYAEHYDTVEINATFYRYFAQTVFARWCQETPDNFRFTLKVPKQITHLKRLIDIDDDLARFIDSIQDLRSKLALFLWQFPYSLKCDEPAKAAFVSLLQRLSNDIKHVFEFRHKSWFNDEIYGLLNRHKAGFVINDSNRFPAAEMVTGQLAYVRFHGPEKLYASPYSTEALRLWAEKMRRWLDHGDVYGYFNNDLGGWAIHNAVELAALIGQQQV
jgi:uncharacterized protein YecE (DUF72 family)